MAEHLLIILKKWYWNIKDYKMINKLILISIFCILLFSCGKKGDPKFKGNEMVFPKSVD